MSIGKLLNNRHRRCTYILFSGGLGIPNALPEAVF